jgi:hypothetical protein
MQIVRPEYCDKYSIFTSYDPSGSRHIPPVVLMTPLARLCVTRIGSEYEDKNKFLNPNQLSTPCTP